MAVLHNEALAFYSERGLKVENVLADDGKEFCGSEGPPYWIHLEPKVIEQRTSKVERPQTNGFVERFNRTALDEFFRGVFRRKLYECIEALQQDLDDRLGYCYNAERPHQGYRNLGRPIEKINEHLQDVRREVQEYRSVVAPSPTDYTFRCGQPHAVPPNIAG